MICVVKEPFDVHVNHKIVVGELDVFTDRCDCILLTPIGAKPIAVVVELCLTDRLQHLQHALLYQPVQYRRSPQWLLFCGAIAFQDFHAADILRFIPDEFTLYRRNQFFVRKFFQVPACSTVCASGFASTICLDVAICKTYVFR